MLHVALVDDQPVNLALLKGLLRAVEHTAAHEFLDPQQAVAWCLSEPVDMVIVDYQMPELDGIGFIRRLRAQADKADVPVIMVTADHELSLRREALEAGANDFLTKPIDRHEFLARVRNMVALRRSQRALADRAEWLAAEVAKATATIAARELDTIMRLSRAAEHRDPETGAHVLRMAHFARLIARELGLPEEEQALLLHAAPMHDVGKVGTPDAILLKPGRLTPEEMAVMRQHAQIGHDILVGSASIYLQAAAEIALSHHERWDGGGYPRGLAGPAIPLHGRIVAVADVFDALTSARPYKPAWSLERAHEYLVQNAGSHFDPACVEAFLRVWPEAMQIRATFADPDSEPGDP